MKKEYTEIVKICLFVVSIGFIVSATKMRIEEGSAGWLSMPAVFSLLYILVYWSTVIKGRHN